MRGTQSMDGRHCIMLVTVMILMLSRELFSVVYIWFGTEQMWSHVWGSFAIR